MEKIIPPKTSLQLLKECVLTAIRFEEERQLKIWLTWLTMIYPTHFYNPIIPIFRWWAEEKGIIDTLFRFSANNFGLSGGSFVENQLVA